MAARFDPFTIEIVKEKLHAAADEMGVVLARTSMSPIVYEVLDFACGITDADAQVVAQTNGLTLFTGTFGPQIQSILRKHGLEGMREGDVFATNIPYEGGTHTCDVCLVKPIVVDHLGSDPARRGQTPSGGRVIGFAVSVTHWIEIGGAVPGSISPEATEIYQEGLQLPGVRVVEQGVPNQTLIDMIEANIRLPRTGIGDLNAGLAATAIGEARVLEACERYGIELVLASFARVLDHGEQIARAELRKIPNGVYTATGVIDGDGVSDDEIPIVVAVTVGDDFLHADFTGCAPQTRGPVNCSTGALLSACKTVVRAITAPSARSNDGFFRPFSLTVPPGTVFSAEPPAPTGWYYEGAALRERPDLEGARSRRPGAAHRRQLYEPLLLVRRRHGRGRRAVRAGEPNVGGWGGSALGDGASALIATTDGDTYNYPRRGGRERATRCSSSATPSTSRPAEAQGAIAAASASCATYACTARARPRATAASAASGACPGRSTAARPATENFLDYPTPDLHLRRGRVPRVELTDGAVVSSVTGTGGGFGDPLEREPERVREDVLDGYITVEQARSRLRRRARRRVARAGRSGDGQAAGTMTLRVATDIGGTFTDLVVFDEETGDVASQGADDAARPRSGRASTTIAAGDGDRARRVEDVLRAWRTTVVINAHHRAEGRTTALVTTRGFRDVLEIGRGNRPDLYNLRLRKPSARSSPRHLRFEVRERVDATGQVRRSARPERHRGHRRRACERDGVEAIAVCFLHSYAQPEHEAGACERASGSGCPASP